MSAGEIVAIVLTGVLCLGCIIMVAAFIIWQEKNL